MKTPLPEKMQYDLSAMNYFEAYSMDKTNQIITYLEEREEEVNYTKLFRDGVTELIQHYGIKEKAQPEKPGLKETLLEEIRSKSWSDWRMDEKGLFLKDVEAIINKLMP
jgi:hypothetical protein